MLDKRIGTDEFDREPDFRVYISQIMELFGDNEREILDFMNTADQRYVSYFSEFYEEMIEKFPSDEMENMFARYL